MKRTAFRRQRPLRQQRYEGADVEREPKPWAVALVAAAKPLRAGTYEGATSGVPVAKEDAHRDDALLQMAKGRACLLLVPGICNHRMDTTVACHENQSKGMAIKASDERSVWGCFACHLWFDAGTAPRAQKRQTFMEAHLRQVLAWRQIATDPAEPERFRRAARRALERLNATPPREAP